MFYQRLRALLTLGLFFMLLTFCDDLTKVKDEASASMEIFRVSLKNDTATNISIIGEDEEFSTSNTLAPGTSREYKGVGFPDSGVLFRAAIFTERWVELAHVECVFRFIVSDERIVSYRGVQAMVCENW